MSVKPMMKIQIHESRDRLILEVQGRLAGAWVSELEDCWQKSVKTRARRELYIDLTGLIFVDQAGHYLLRLMCKEGVNLIGNDLLQQEILRPNQT